MRGFDAADSERTVRPESPTSPPSTSLHSHANKNRGKGGKGKEITTFITERGVNHDQAASGQRTSHWGDCAKHFADTCYTASGPRAGFLTDKAQHKRKVNEWATECATHIFQSKNRNSRTLKICPAPSTWMDGVYRVVRWVMRGFDAADSERTVRPESPTSPMLRSDLPRKTAAPNARGRTAIQGISPSDESENSTSHSAASTLFQLAGKTSNTER